MKQKKNAGKHQTGKAGTSRRRHLPRQSAISGLALTTLLLSAGISEQASALTFTFDYTYRIVANTCTLSVQGADGNPAISTTGKTVLNVGWGTVTQEQLTDSRQASEKTFGLVMDCAGDIYAPTLTVISKNGVVSPSGTLYVKETEDSVAGFAVRASNEASEQDVTKKAISQAGSGQQLDETKHQKKMLLTAWPTILPDKDPKDLKPGDYIKGTVTINVVYN